MKTIPLTLGKEALVDDEDYDCIAGFQWYAVPRKHTCYAQRNVQINGKPTNVLMHRIILGAEKGQDVDHKDGNGLNNQRSNIRLCTRSENLRNQRPFRSRHGFKGVTVIKRTYKVSNPYRAEIRIDGKGIHLGYFRTKQAAAFAYNKAAMQRFGEYALLNKI